MILGIALLGLAAVGALGVVAGLAGSSIDGTVEVGAIAVSGTVGSGLLVATAVVATAAAFAGTLAIVAHRRRASYGAFLDSRADEAEEEARSRLLAMRLDVLRREIEQAEQRRDAAVEAAPTRPARKRRTKRDEDLVVLPNAH